MSLKWNAFDQLPGDQCSQGIALHTARPLKNGGALPIFYANPLNFDGFKI